MTELSRKSAAELKALLGQLPVPGTRWRHRASGCVYHVLALCIIEATQTPAVAYADDICWVRPLDEFLERFEPAQEPI